ncbi:hypothetical protein KC727_01690 [Candidatus Kaiserbacteria bacterium]|nr:hypothetical protein [Candidatus Kaiserbacteria bacterium]
MDIVDILQSFIQFAASSVLPFLLAVAFIAVLFNVVRFFIIGSHDEEGRENARKLALWSTLAFVLILGLWGIVSVFLSAFGIENSTVAPAPDYIEDASFNNPTCSAGQTSRCKEFSGETVCWCQ